MLMSPFESFDQREKVNPHAMHMSNIEDKVCTTTVCPQLFALRLTHQDVKVSKANTEQQGKFDKEHNEFDRTAAAAAAAAAVPAPGEGGGGATAAAAGGEAAGGSAGAGSGGLSGHDAFKGASYVKEQAVIHDEVKQALYAGLLGDGSVKGMEEVSATNGLRWVMENKEYHAAMKREGRLTECVQGPGDLVFVPAGWSHGTINLGDAVGVANEFCTASTGWGISETMYGAGLDSSGSGASTSGRVQMIVDAQSGKVVSRGPQDGRG